MDGVDVWLEQALPVLERSRLAVPSEAPRFPTEVVEACGVRFRERSTGGSGCSGSLAVGARPT